MRDRHWHNNGMCDLQHCPCCATTGSTCWQHGGCCFCGVLNDVHAGIELLQQQDLHVKLLRLSCKPVATFVVAENLAWLSNIKAAAGEGCMPLLAFLQLLKLFMGSLCRPTRGVAKHQQQQQLMAAVGPPHNR